MDGQRSLFGRDLDETCGCDIVTSVGKNHPSFLNLIHIFQLQDSVGGKLKKYLPHSQSKILQIVNWYSHNVHKLESGKQWNLIWLDLSETPISSYAKSDLDSSWWYISSTLIVVESIESLSAETTPFLLPRLTGCLEIDRSSFS